MLNRIGPFEVIREIGRGGMGVVYLAKDTRLDRQVAIKSLPSELAAEASRLERFEREAKILAGLHDPNIAGIYGVEEQAGVKYLVLEFVEGESLAERLDRGSLPIDEAIDLAVQIASGLEAAHDAGVIHRDLKPGNIVITPEGNAKVLDFGLARFDEGSQSSSGTISGPTATMPRESPTVEGAVLGTAAYMSPEQARGRRVDKRTDIWSFGVVLYEMLAGTSPFRGETASDSIGAVLHKPFDLAQLPPPTPANVRRLLERCLQRDKNLRYRDIGDVQLDLIERTEAAAELQEQRTSRVPLIAAAAIVLITIVAASIVVAFSRQSPAAEASPVALSIPIPPGLEQRGPIAISPDGSTIAIAAADQFGRQAIYVRNLNDFTFRMVSGSEDGYHPFFSPDSQSVGFFARDGLYRSLLDGDRTTRIVGCASNTGATWTDDDVIIYSNGLGSPLLRVTANGRVLEPLTSLTEPELAIGHVWPQQIPGTPYLLFTTWGADETRDEAGNRTVGGARILDTRDGRFRAESEMATRGFASPVRWSPSGHAIFEDFSSGILVLPFDPSSESVLAFNEASPLIPDVQHYGRRCRSFFDIANNGTIAYVPQTDDDARLVWVEPDGSVEEIMPGSAVSQISQSFGKITLNSNGTRLLFGIGDIGVIDLERRIARNILSSDGNDSHAAWGPDENSVVFCSTRGGRFELWTAATDSMGEPVLLLGTENNIGSPSMAANGSVTYNEDLPNGDENVWLLSADGEATPIASSRFVEEQPEITLDGQVVAFKSNVTGQDEIFVAKVGSSVPAVQITQAGGDSPRWSHDGRTLYFRRGRSVWRVPVLDGQPAGEPQSAFPAERLALGKSYDILPDGSRMIAVQLNENGLVNEVRVRTQFFGAIRAVADKP